MNNFIRIKIGSNINDPNRGDYIKDDQFLQMNMMDALKRYYYLSLDGEITCNLYFLTFSIFSTLYAITFILESEKAVNIFKFTLLSIFTVDFLLLSLGSFSATFNYFNYED